SNSDHTWERFVTANPSLSNHTHQTVHLGLGSGVTDVTLAPGHNPAVMMIGRLDTGEDYKGHRQMIEAWPLVLRNEPAAELWIVGDGNLRPCLEETARREGVQRAVRFCGRISDDEKDALLKTARAL